MARSAPRGAVTSSAVPAEVIQAARAEGLRYTSDQQPGYTRIRRGKQFIFRDTNGKRISDRAVIARIRKLAIPPAYEDVWICPHANGHLQATGRDARGRKQYRYHPQWREHRDGTKFDRMLEFGRALPRIRKRVARDLRVRGLPREKVIATIVRLLECTLIRVGNEEYARTNGSFGLTTLRNRHAAVKGDTLMLEFRGKSGVMQKALVSDRAVTRIVKSCRDIPGQDLFQWIDDQGERRPVGSADVNDYLRDATGGPFTAKDFRTWFATLEALELLRKQRANTKGEARKQVLEAVKNVSERLGNTPAICRKCYIHPVILSSHEAGQLATLAGQSAPLALRALLSPRGKKAANGLARRQSRKSPTHRMRFSPRRSPRLPTVNTSSMS